jgi:hypothetical protein
MSGYKTLDLVVESQSFSSSDPYDPYPISTSENSNSVLTEEKTHSRIREHPIMAAEKIHSQAREHLPTCVPIQDENEKEEE